MRILLHKSFVVQVPLQDAWEHVAQVSNWPRWAGHIRQVEAEPCGVLGADSRATLLVKPGLRLTFEMVEYSPLKHWEWAGRLMQMTLHHAHHFEALDGGTTRLTWTVLGDGPGSRVLGRLFATGYGLLLDRAIRRLAWELNVYRNPDPGAAYRAV